MKNREELLISRGSKDLLQFTKTRIAMSYTSWSPNSLSLSLARDLSQLVSLSQFQTQPKAHRFLLPSILNPKKAIKSLPPSLSLSFPFPRFHHHRASFLSFSPAPLTCYYHCPVRAFNGSAPRYKTPQTDSLRFKCYWTTRRIYAQMLGSLAGVKPLLSLSLSLSCLSFHASSFFVNTFFAFSLRVGGNLNSVTVLSHS